nr:PREDICTED: venom allergen 5-like [Tribolium castaneum]|eukprot:XP_008194999.2 PREDICTED: venom allergen 5-like [Tribolium castaneum]
MAFRQFIVDEHNYYRNLMASGNESRGFAQAVADMLVVNYDLELEYLARCYGRSFFNGDHDECRVLQNEKKAGQNLGGTSVLPKKGYGQAQNAIRAWYKEVAYMEKSVYERFHKLKTPIGHFTAMCWGAVDSVGCAQIYSKDPKKDKFKGANFHTHLICDYAARKLKTNINVSQGKMLTFGPPCSKCPSDEKFKNCSTKYTSLCGELQPIPKERPYDFGNASSKICGKVYILVLAFAVLMVL